MFERLAAFGAELSGLQRRGRNVNSFLRCFGSDDRAAGHLAGADHIGDLLDPPGDCVRAGGAAHPVPPDGGRTADPAQLLQDFVDRNAGAQRNGHQPRGGLRLGGAAARLAGGGEHLTDAVLIVVDGDVEVAAADLHALGNPAGDLRARTRENGVGGCGRLGIDRTDVEHLVLPAAVAVDGDPLTAQLKGQTVDLGHVLVTGLVGEVYRLGDGVVHMILEGGLHLDMVGGTDVVRADEHFADVLGDLLNVGERAGPGDLLHQLVRVEAALLEHTFQDRIDLHHLGLVHHVADIDVGEDRLNARGAPGDDRQGAGRGDGGHGAIAQGFVFPGVDALLEEGEAAALLSKPHALLPPGIGDEPHHLPGELHRLVRGVGEAHAQQQIRPAHHSEPDLAGLLGGEFDLLKGIFVDLDDVVQKVDRIPHRGAQLVIVELHHAAVGLGQHVAQVDRPEVAGLVGQQRLLAARVGALDLPLAGHHVVPVETVEEDDPRLAVMPSAVHDLFKHLACAELSDRLLALGVDQLVVPVLFGGHHELLGDPDRDVEVGDVLIVLLAVDEIQDIGMVDPQDTHVGAPAGAALLDRLGGHVEHPHEAHRAAGHTAGGAHRAPLGAQAGKGEAGAAAGFVDQRRLLDRLEDGVHTVLHRQHEAGRELAEGPAGVHQGGGVGQKVKVGHHLIKALFGLRDVGLPVKGLVRLGDRPGDPVEHPLQVLDGLAVLVLDEIALFQHGKRVFGNFHYPFTPLSC